MPTREDLIKQLKEDPKFREALGRARTTEERKALQRLVEEFVGGFAPLLQQIDSAVKQDPHFVEKLGKALAEKQGVLNPDPPRSGSI